MTLEERVQAWSYRRQQLGRAGSDDAPATLANTVAVYASQPSAILTLAARLPRIDLGQLRADFRRLEADRIAIRIPAMRGSAHLVPPAPLRSTIQDRLAEVATLLGASGFDAVEGPPRGRRLA
jgi:hypothetical protein